MDEDLEAWGTYVLTYERMASEELVFTLAYIVVAVCFIHPPTEFVSAGLTIQNLLGSFLGSEDLNFVYHHIKRTTVTVIIHSLLPLGMLTSNVSTRVQFQYFYFNYEEPMYILS